MHNFSFSHFFSKSQDNLVYFSAPRPISYKNIKEYNLFQDCIDTQRINTLVKKVGRHVKFNESADPNKYILQRSNIYSEQ